MNRITEKLASLHLTAWNLVTMILWLGWGLIMAGSENFAGGFKGMNNTLLRDWLLSRQSDFLILKVWFAGLCLLMVLLGINLIFCSWDKIFRIIRIKFNGPKLFMLIVHGLFGLVALGHLGGLMLGYEHSNIRLGEGKGYFFEEDYEIKIAGINFVSDPAVLEKSKKDITNNEFDYKRNFAEIILEKNGREIRRGKIFYLNPMVYKGIQITLGSFISPPEKDNEMEKDFKPWIALTVSRNPVLKYFMVVYPLMVAGIFIHLILTWRLQSKNSDNHFHKET